MSKNIDHRTRQILLASLLTLILLSTSIDITYSQGPPLLTDKPIMLGKHHGTARMMYYFQSSSTIDGHFIMPMADFNITNQLSIEGGMMVADYLNDLRKMTLTDLMFSAKYQYFKFDKKGYTYRLSVKGAKAIRVTKFHSNIKPTGPMPWGTYGGALLGIETLRYGLVAEIGLNHVPDLTPRESGTFFQGKVALGVPLLPHVFPVKQLNLYAESELVDRFNAESMALFVSPGIQYVYRVWALECTWQKRLYHQGNRSYYPDATFFIGLRYIY